MPIGKMHSRPQKISLVWSTLGRNSILTWSSIMMKTPFATTATAAVKLAIVQAALRPSGDIKTGIMNLETSCKPEAENLFQRRDAVPAHSR
jgi:hypothetical protein